MKTCILEKEMQPAPVFLPGNSMDRGAWRATLPWGLRIGHKLATKQQKLLLYIIYVIYKWYVIVYNQYFAYLC